MCYTCLCFIAHVLFWAAGRRPYIVFTFTGSVWNVQNDVNIYICQQHGGREVGTKSFGYISVKFICLLLILSAKGLLDQKSSSK